MTEIQFTSRLTLDETFFGRIDRFVDLMTRLDDQVPDDSDLRGDPTYQALLAHRKIDHFSVVTSALPEVLSSPSDFSDASIRARIAAGYEDAVHHLLTTVPFGRHDMTARRHSSVSAAATSAMILRISAIGGTNCSPNSRVKP